MKKITKIGLLSLALLGCLSVLNVSASTGDTKTVSLSLTAGNNSCNITGYDFGSKPAAVSAIDLEEISHDITCTFLENAASTVSLALTDLSDGPNTIKNNNFTFAVAAAGHTGLISDLSATANTFATSTNIYSKELNKLGSWASTLTLSGVIPAGTPSGSYTGTLNLTIQGS